MIWQLPAKQYLVGSIPTSVSNDLLKLKMGASPKPEEPEPEECLLA